MAVSQHDITPQELRAAHANAEAWRVEYPAGAEFAERHPLTLEQTRIPTDPDVSLHLAGVPRRRAAGGVGSHVADGVPQRGPARAR
jgi:hypothetical protein